MKNKNILIVTSEFPPQPGGIGNHALHLALSLQKENYSVHVIADQRSVSGEEEVAFDATLPFHVVRIQRERLRFKMYIQRIFATYRAFSKANHVIATGKFSLWNVAFITLFKKRNTLAVVHGSEVNFKPFLLKKSIDISLQRFHRIVAVSKYTKSLITHINKEVTVIPNGICLEHWETEKVPKKVLPGNPVLTTVGRVSTRKGQLQVIMQLPALLKAFPTLHYHCVGIPTEATAFLEKATQLGVEKHITFHGSVNDFQLKEILLQTDVFVMLSTESATGDVEGFGIAILEANALGIPAIGSVNCGIEDAIQNEKSGILIDGKDSMQLQNAIKSILEKKEAFSATAKCWAKQHDWTVLIKRYIALLP
ncbi:glycosyltransferase family 4 protein [Lacinutrix sp. C3R15]|uniref:glycosyltransferase family 4 protein n=1 Tax=Flavobacteriaceae TaxID=49546 RepID=UPI001C08A62F|nr:MULTISPECIES: glycosyltransferase family 4 protein [Flavobacteriaceae]MBU2939587.1 glycosyltransferase family 4 protein [Lacinutrix sp. C3R15]MDO6622901.1 glycosyltransferase family 4 protein [Oceanihabitans sp. 1_MG-2023]